MATRPSQRQRLEEGPSNPPVDPPQEVVEPHPRFTRVQLRDNIQKERFHRLEKRKVVATRFIDNSILNELGICTCTEKLFKDLGMSTMFTMHYDTFDDIVYEFLSSLVVQQNEKGELHLEYRIRNKDWTTTFPEFCELFGLVDTSDDFVPSDFYPQLLFRDLAGSTPTTMQNISINRVHSPSIRIWLKFMAFTITAKSQSNKCTSVELEILASILRPDLGISINLPHLLLQTFQTIAHDTSNNRSDITCGGLVTCLAVANGLKITPTNPRDRTTISREHLMSSRWIKIVDGRFFWKTEGHDNIPIPTILLPSLNPNLPSYLFSHISEPLSRPESHFQPQPQSQHPQSCPPPLTYQRRGRVGAGQDSSSSSLLHSQHEEMMQALRQLQVGIDQIYNDQRLGMYPIYDYFFQHGMIPQDHTHPSWYRPPQVPFTQPSQRRSTDQTSKKGANKSKKSTRDKGDNRFKGNNKSKKGNRGKAAMEVDEEDDDNDDANDDDDDDYVASDDE